MKARRIDAGNISSRYHLASRLILLICFVSVAASQLAECHLSNFKTEIVSYCLPEGLCPSTSTENAVKIRDILAVGYGISDDSIFRTQRSNE
jgi:hypothetical protein